MTVHDAPRPGPQRRGRVIALHCSGAGAAQWRYLEEALGRRYELLAPEHYGCESSGAWGGEHAFTLADEAARSIGLIDRIDGQVHLVGHSYGGGVALSVALARPERIASMVLYEPSAFHLLRQMGPPANAAFAEIVGVAGNVSRGVVCGDHRTAMASFVDYWNGPGTYAAMRPGMQGALLRWAPKAPLDFHALIEEPTPSEAYRSFDFPVLVLRGQLGPTPTRLIAERLVELIADSRLITVAGAGHMGPVTHAAEVSGLVVQHIEAASARLRTSWPLGAHGRVDGTSPQSAEVAP